jgi:hypothetical protein
LAQDQSGAANVSVESYGNDMVGRSLVYEVKEEFRDSEAFNLVSSADESIPVITSTMPKNKNNPSIATIYSVKWVYSVKGVSLPYYLDGTLGYCGSDVVESSARSIVASTDKLVSEIIDYYNSKQRSGQKY